MFEKLSNKSVKKDRKLDLEGEHMWFSAWEHMKDNYEDVVGSAMKRQRKRILKQL